MPAERTSNRLSGETSPYLLQHADNPVDWYPWGEEAFERARREDKPVFLSIGYSACHWCHVMERESFDDEQIARFLNEHFISIKVDREERPDVDAVYMNAVQLMTGSGGWPLTVFLTPDGRPFFGGTYFPPTDRSGFPGLRRVLEEIAQFYAGRRVEVGQAAQRLTAALRAACEVEPRGRPDTDLSRDILGVAYRNIAAAFDGDYGGFGRAPKFPHPTALAFLLRYHAASGEPHALAMVEMTLERMACGGICDQLGGGFHRYATDARWLIPHFEKMLNDNALLAGVYLDAFLLTAKPHYERIVRETLDYVLREMTAATGGFCASQDADAGGREGDFFVWTADEVRAVVGPQDADVVLRHFGVEPIGNLEGAKSVLSIAATAEDFAKQTGRDLAAVETAIAEGRKALFEIRAERIPPATDDKILAGWNGLMISAMARAGAVLGEDRYLQAAGQAADFVLAHLRRPDGGLWRSWRDGRNRANGCLTDYGFLVAGLLDLYESTLERRWLEWAVSLAEQMVERFWDSAGGGFFYAEGGDRALPARHKDSFDSPDPSGNAAAVLDLLRLAELTGRESFQEKAAATLRLFAPTIIRAALDSGHMLAALDFLTAPPQVVVVAGPGGDPATAALVRATQGAYAPNKTVVFVNTADQDQTRSRLDDLVPAAAGKTPVDGRPAAYVCQARTCGPPITEPEKLMAVLARSGSLS